MKSSLTRVSAGVLVFAALDQLYAQYVPPAAPPFPGFINDYFSSVDAYATHWNIGGDDRERYVAYEGYAVPGSAGSADFRAHGASVDNQYLLSRIRLHAGYTNDWLGAYAEGQSSMATSDHRAAYANVPAVPGTSRTYRWGPESDTIDLHQAYVSVGNFDGVPIWVKVGRQEMKYGDERLIGAFDWNNIGRSFDAAKLRWQPEWGTVDLFAGMPVVPRDDQFDMPNNQDRLSGIYATFTKVPTTIVEGYFLARNATRSAINFVSDPQFPQPTARDIYTAGGRLKSKPGAFGGFDYTIEGAYQFGDFASTPTSARLRQDAYMFAVQGGYTFTNCWASPRLGAEFDYASGDNNPTDGTHGTFDTLFPTPHKFFGSMDLFSLQNIQDLGVSLTLKPAPRTTVALMGNAFWLADTHDSFYNAGGVARGTGGYGINPGFSPFVGTELTVIAGYAVTKFAQLEVGYGHFFSGKYVTQSQAVNGGARDADLAYVQTVIKF